ncbi:MarR family winged helix-turn-helix transcriptional regulator [Limosilactobacillus sp.]|jgi:DNA-binding MarR family transcriptional regulator|uniref:MarR family winged helix-turn-helix transcriptional regulator n=1 Tax=Limosilactobacillus sp. TaxID=2773925 RepID=UPI0025C4EBF2|nr:MarR family transcriptional regulator [Limosilactobacillus sp.]MCH3922885.1 MarR family transcriptional regulator [Limosilactobacillus sp.]MCH3927568.1 MarR family transcriptional regulator [Limosilactobacillus sp.]
MADDYQEINRALIRVYNGIVWIEEKELRESTFRDLTIKEMHAIDAITMYDHQTVSEVAKKLHLTPGTMTAMVDRLIAKGYAERFRDQEDRRMIRLGLTHKGRVLYRAHRAFHNMMVKSFLKDMDETELKTVHKALHNLEDFLEEHS